MKDGKGNHQFLESSQVADEAIHNTSCYSSLAIVSYHLAAILKDLISSARGFAPTRSALARGS